MDLQYLEDYLDDNNCLTYQYLFKIGINEYINTTIDNNFKKDYYFINSNYTSHDVEIAYTNMCKKMNLQLHSSKYGNDGHNTLSIEHFGHDDFNSTLDTNFLNKLIEYGYDVKNMLTQIGEHDENNVNGTFKISCTDELIELFLWIVSLELPDFKYNYFDFPEIDILTYTY